MVDDHFIQTTFDEFLIDIKDVLTIKITQITIVRFIVRNERLILRCVYVFITNYSV